MAADKDDAFKKVGRSTATTLSSPGYTISNTSINVASTSNWPTDTGVTFAIDEVDSDGVRVNGTYNIFKGVVSGATQITSVEYVGGDANRDYSAGATTRVYIDVDYSRHNELVDGLVAEHNQDGTHSDITADSVDTDTLVVNTGTTLPAGDIVTADLADGAATSEKQTSTVSFFAYRNGAWSTTNGTAKVNLDTEVYDEGADFDNSTNYRFVAPYDGIYQFSATVTINNGTSRRCNAILYKNGSEYARGSSIDATFPASHVSATIKLAASEYVELYLTSNAATTGGVGQAQTFMSGYSVGRY